MLRIRPQFARQSLARFYSTRQKILFLDNVVDAKAEFEQLKKKADVVTLKEGTDRQAFLNDLKNNYKDINAIFRTFISVKKTGRFDEELAKALPESCKAVCHYGAGYDQIDVPFFSERGIQVSNVQSMADESTALTNLYLMIGTLRNFGDGALNLQKGQWLKGVALGNDISGKTLGILGMGGIGREIRDYVAPLGFNKVLYYNRNRLAPELEKDSVYCESPEELFSKADVISINVPLNAATKHLVNAESISKMKDGVIIVNTARGPVCDEKALVDGLNSGKIGGVGLDVFEREPAIEEGLLKHPRTLLLPHMGTWSHETHYKMEKAVLDNLESFVDTGKVLSIVPEQKGKF